MFSVREKLEKKRKIKFFISIFIFVISISVFGFCLFKMYENKQQGDKANSEYKELATVKEQNEEKEKEIPKFHKDLLNKNPDYVGWIEIPGTRVDYPVLQSDDNEKYLKLTFEGSVNEVGAIFEDCNCNPNFESINTVIHGHSRLDKSMFGGLHEYRSEDYKNKHSKLVIKRKDGKEFIYKIFSTSVVDIKNPVYLSRGNEEESRKYVDSLGIGKNKKVLTLSTCISSRPGSTQRRIVQAVLEE